MSNLDLALCILAASIGVPYGLKLVGVFGQFKEIKAKGETPMVKATLFGMAAAIVVEILVVFTYTQIYFNFIDIHYLTAMVFAISVYLIKDVVAHFAMLGYWGIIVKLNEKKFKESLKRDIRKMGGEA